MRMPPPSSAARSVGSVLVGPGSTSATPPGPCRTAVAMMWGTSRNWRSTNEMPGASVFMRTLFSPPPTEHGDDGGGRHDRERDQSAAPNPALERVPALAERVADNTECDGPGHGAGSVPEQERR